MQVRNKNSKHLFLLISTLYISNSRYYQEEGEELKKLEELEKIERIGGNIDELFPIKHKVAGKNKGLVLFYR